MEFESLGREFEAFKAAEKKDDSEVESAGEIWVDLELE